CLLAGPRHIIITQTLMSPRTGRPLPRPRACRSLLLIACSAGAISALSSSSTAMAAPPSAYSASEVVVGYAPQAAGTSATAARTARSVAGVRTRVLRLAPGDSVTRALRRLRAQRGVQWAVPNFLAHTAGALVPNDEGNGHAAKAWQQLQWNFVGTFGVDAPEAWANLAADGAPGGAGVTVAVLDTGLAYANRRPFRRSPDLGRHQFVQGYDFVAKNRYPSDHNGHGTFVAGTIAEATNNRYGLTGLAYGVHIMPVRVLDSGGEGEASTIAEGVLFAVKHGAQVINLS